MDDYTREWINFLRSSAEDLKKSIPRPERYLTSSVLTLIIGVVAALAGWFGRLGGCWEKLLGGIGIAIILLILGALCLAYGIHLRSEQSRISKEKDNILMLIAMILGKRVISPEEIFNEWQKCEKKVNLLKNRKKLRVRLK